MCKWTKPIQSSLGDRYFLVSSQENHVGVNHVSATIEPIAPANFHNWVVEYLLPFN